MFSKIKVLVLACGARSLLQRPLLSRAHSRRSGQRLTVQMPTLFVTSANYPRSGAESFCRELSSCVSSCLGKPESFVLVSYTKTDAMSFGGDADLPAAFLYCSSLGAINKDNNQKLSAEIASILKEELGVTKDRYYINFFDSPRENCGWKGGTF